MENKTVIKKKCEHCGKTIVPLGSKRANGTYHEDWPTRKLHKKCWKLLQK